MVGGDLVRAGGHAGDDEAAVGLGHDPTGAAGEGDPGAFERGAGFSVEQDTLDRARRGGLAAGDRG